MVSLPYGFTLFSNTTDERRERRPVSLPYGFTLFSNATQETTADIAFHYLMDLHYSQTEK